MKKYKMKITVFLCGALDMVLELVAARILSPYVGSSNLIWTTIIGIMLTSMSIGYWVGGKIADKKPDIKVLSLFILIGAFFTSLIPIFETVLVKPLSAASNQLVLVAIICSAVVFGIPSFILAMVTPFAVKLEDESHDDIGRTSGSVSSLSTIGSIVGTFVAGFLLIPNLGVRMLIVIITVVLFILSFMMFDKKSIKYSSLMFFILIILLILNYCGKVLFENNNPDIIADVDSQYSRIWIKNVSTEDTIYKTMQVDTGLESYINQSTNEMGSAYLYYYNLFDYFNKDAKSTLMIGGAAYTYPTYYLNNYEDKVIDVVE
jgi:predicted membrane-bound spermidine synthase